MNEITKISPIAAGARLAPIVPTSFEDAFRIARVVIAANMAPAGIKTPEEAVLVIMHGLEVGLSPMVALQSIALINRRPALYGDGALAVVRSSGLLQSFSETISEDDLMVASCTVKRRGEKSLTRTFSKADATAAGLWAKAGPWTSYPKRMLQMRARAFALRDAFADIMRGLGIKEELDDVVPTTAEAPPPPMIETSSSPLQAAIEKASNPELDQKIIDDEAFMETLAAKPPDEAAHE